MKAMLINKYGEPDVFRFGEIEKPKIKDNEILVKVAGSSVNPVDCGIRRGLLKSYIRLKLPAVLGVDASGGVVEAGKNVKKFKVGDNVYAFLGIKNNGGYGEYVSVPESYAALTPKNINLAEAGVIPGVGLTAYEAFYVQTELKAGEKVLINGAAGGVGTYAVQFAKNLGAEVTGVCSTSKVDFIKQLGADKVINYNKEDLYSVKGRYDVVLNCVRGAKMGMLKKLLNPRGRLIEITGNPLLTPFIKITNVFSSKKIFSFFVKTDGENLKGLTELIEAGKAKPVIEKTYSWIKLPEAHMQVETGRVTGKICIRID
jgi:NADPH:quinone reductase-like Zn-dependent oxidoreductase